MTLPKPFDNWTTYDGHPGIDFPEPAGTPIPALGDGVVTFVGWNKTKLKGDRFSPGKAAGNARIIDYGGGVQVRICHLENLTGPKKGDRVKLGDDTGPVGATGLATGPHLHMEVWVNGVIQTGDNFWRYISRTRTAPTPALAGGNAEEFDMPLSADDLKKIETVVRGSADHFAYTLLGRETPGLESSTGGPIPDETVARRLRVLRAHTNDMQRRMNTQDAQLAALTAAVKTLAASKGLDQDAVEAEIRKSVADALDGWSLTFTPGEPDQ